MCCLQVRQVGGTDGVATSSMMMMTTTMMSRCSMTCRPVAERNQRDIPTGISRLVTSKTTVTVSLTEQVRF